jgi:mono/diheme cytochrome c family protein
MSVAGWVPAVLALMAVGANFASAQEVGQPEAGRALAQRICADCHAVLRGQARSPRAGAPTFEAIARVPRMTAAALTVALRTSHRTMPNIMLEQHELDDVVAYVLSLKPGG